MSETPSRAGELSYPSGRLGGTTQTGPAVAATTVTRTLTADKERLMSDPTPTRPRVSRTSQEPGRPWLTTCPCGFTWHSRHYSVAVTMAVYHTHLRAA